MMISSPRRVSHQLQQLLVASQRRGQRGEELVGGELGLRLVVVDVVVDDDAALRRLARLAGAQDDADGLVLQLLADELDELEPRPFRLHHDVEQDDRHVGMRAEELARLRGRARREQLQAAAVQREILQREARAGRARAGSSSTIATFQRGHGGAGGSDGSSSIRVTNSASSAIQGSVGLQPRQRWLPAMRPRPPSPRIAAKQSGERGFSDRDSRHRMRREP